MNVVLLVDKYYPMPYANENCARAILDAVENCHVDVICKVTNKEEYEEVKRLNSGITPILVQQSSTMMDSSILGKLKYILKKAWNLFFGKLYPTRTTKDYISSFEEICRQRKIDAVVAVQNPTDSVEAAYRLKSKYPELKMIIYDLDTASNHSIGPLERLFQDFYLNKVYSWEKKVFSKADLIIHLAQHRSHFTQARYTQFLEKTLFQEVPLLKCDTAPECRRDDTPISFVYSGSFYWKLRPPHLITDLMDYVCKTEDCMVKYYVNSRNHPALSQKYTGSEKVLVSSFVPEQQLKEILRNADFLLSLGNKESKMFPSKVVQYVAARKPIIHVYQSKIDPVIPFLENYPDRLLIDSNGNFDENCRKILAFIHQERPTISAEDIEKQYEAYTGSYNAAQIIDFLKN